MLSAGALPTSPRHGRDEVSVLDDNHSTDAAAAETEQAGSSDLPPITGAGRSAPPQSATDLPTASVWTEARRLVGKGLSVLPLYRPVFDSSGELVGCTCGRALDDESHGTGARSVGKHPAPSRGVHGAVATIEQVDDLWSSGSWNLGVVMGAVRDGYRLWALDADTADAAEATRRT